MKSVGRGKYDEKGVSGNSTHLPPPERWDFIRGVKDIAATRHARHDRPMWPTGNAENPGNSSKAWHVLALDADGGVREAE
jgi:hypothetical protein